MTGPGESHMIRVVLADREQLLGQALSRLIDAESDMTVTGVCADGDSLLRDMGQRGADVVLMDPIGLTALGMEMIRRVLSAFPSTHVVVLTANQQEQQLFAAIRAGARGYISKSADIHEVLEAI